MSGLETPSKRFLRYNNDYNYEEYTKLALLAAIKNEDKRLTPQNSLVSWSWVVNITIGIVGREMAACCIITGQVTTIKIILNALVWERGR